MLDSSSSKAKSIVHHGLVKVDVAVHLLRLTSEVFVTLQVKRVALARAVLVMTSHGRRFRLLMSLLTILFWEDQCLAALASDFQS